MLGANGGASLTAMFVAWKPRDYLMLLDSWSCIACDSEASQGGLYITTRTGNVYKIVSGE